MAAERLMPPTEVNSPDTTFQQLIIESNAIDSNSAPKGRVLRLYSWVYPFFGVYYSLRYPLLIGPHFVLPALKTGVTLALTYPILSNGFQAQEKYLHIYLSSTRFNRYSWVFIAGLWVLQQGWMQYFMYDRITKFFARGLLLKAYHVVSENMSTISISDTSTAPLNQGKLQLVATSIISAPEGETPKIKHRPVSTAVVNSFSRALYFLVPSSKGIWSFFWGRLIPSSLLLVLPPGIGAFTYGMTAGPTRALNLIKPYFKSEEGPGSSSENRAWTKRHSLPLRFLGFSAALLEMVPFVGPLFAFTNTVGASIWLATYFPPRAKTD
ncbi:hypothetical protein DSO57_1004883 [Entomophthora muscae]|uniref:Uncharacterized protein n=1 Tax=Entomophthora muscae TaxID=34485 RepID=A0ACC2TVG5_9FUNG|nr:hypothetical protein DSO57_1004883 [Entomophthora muscae]